MSDNNRSSRGLTAGTLPASELVLEIPAVSSIVGLALGASPPAVVPPEIHRRRLLFSWPAGVEVPDPDNTPELRLTAPLGMEAAAAAAVDPNDLVLATNTALGSAVPQDFASAVGEPSVATRNLIVFMTGNWYAAISVDGGATFQWVDPFHTFPDPPGSGFCCDQVVLYMPGLDAFVWLLQYTGQPNGENRQRLAFARTADVIHGTWKFFDITSQNLGLAGIWLDFPDLALGSNMLYVTTNAFRGNNWEASVAVRLPLRDLQRFLDGTGQPTAQFALSRDNASFRVAQHCLTRGVWATHQTTSSIRVFTWPETAPQPSFQDVQVASWAGGDFQSTTPEGFNWLDRCDPRMVGATRRPGDEFWFAWGANRGGANNRPNPYIQIARLRLAGGTATLLENINLWDQNLATSYGALSTNSRGEVGVAYFSGGATQNPSPAVGFLTDPRKFALAATGAHGPAQGQWGDYLSVRRHYGPSQRFFSATGYTLDRGTGRRDGNPRFIRFGRARDVP